MVIYQVQVSGPEAFDIIGHYTDKVLAEVIGQHARNHLSKPDLYRIHVGEIKINDPPEFDLPGIHESAIETFEFAKFPKTE